MIKDIQVKLENKVNCKWIEVDLPNQTEEEFAQLTILNDLGDHVLTLNLTGKKHKIDLTYLKLRHCNIKIETSTQVIMKKVF